MIRRGSARAVLIGVADYDSEKRISLSKLPQATNNIDRLRELLCDSEHGGFEPADIRLVRDPPTTDDLLVAIEEHGAAAEGLLLVYYSGHGLLRTDGDSSSLVLTATDSMGDTRRGGDHLGFGDFKDLVLATGTARVKAIILDCCYAGAGHRDTASRPAALMEPVSEESPQGEWVLAAASALEPARVGQREGDRYTVMTGELIRVLEEGIPGRHRVLTLGVIGTAVTGRMDERRRGEDYRISRSDPRSTGNAFDAPLCWNPAYDEDWRPPARPDEIEAVFAGRSADSLRAYALPSRNRNGLPWITEEQRVELGLLWGADRGRFVGVLADRLSGNVDLVRDLDEIERRLARAAERAGHSVPARVWSRLRPIQVQSADGPMPVLEELPRPPAAGRLHGVVVPIHVGPRSRLIDPARWRELLRRWLPQLSRRLHGCALVMQVQAIAAVDAIWSAQRLAPFVAEFAGGGEGVPFDLAARFLPGDTHDAPGGSEKDVHGSVLRILVDDICQEERRRGLATTLQPVSGSGRPRQIWNAGLAHVLVAELHDGPGAKLGYGAPCPDQRLLELTRAYTPLLWRFLRRVWALEATDQRPMVALAAQLDQDLDVWLAARWDGPGLAQTDLPVSSEGEPEAIVRGLRRMGVEVDRLPGWLVRRCSRATQRVIRDAESAATEDAADFLARSGLSPSFSPRTGAYWRTVALTEPTTESLAALLALPEPQRHVVCLSVQEPDLEPQLTAVISELRGRLRPRPTVLRGHHDR